MNVRFDVTMRFRWCRRSTKFPSGPRSRPPCAKFMEIAKIALRARDVRKAAAPASADGAVGSYRPAE